MHYALRRGVKAQVVVPTLAASLFRTVCVPLHIFDSRKPYGR